VLEELLCRQIVRLTVSPDGTVDMSAEDAEYLIGAGWTKIAEGVCEDKA